MRLKSVLYVLGKILFAAAAILLLPAVCAIIYKESPLPFLLPSFCLRWLCLDTNVNRGCPALPA